MKYLEEKGLGFDTGVARVPVVPAAILFDLAIGKASVRPDAYMGYQACLNASERPVPQGCVGAGTGATAGNALGPKQSTKSGIGSASLEIGGGLGPLKGKIWRILSATSTIPKPGKSLPEPVRSIKA